MPFYSLTKRMAIAIQSQSKRSSSFYLLTKLRYWLFDPFRWLWWHLHAYSVILGIMALTVFSVIVLYGYEQLRAWGISLQKRFVAVTERSPEFPISIKQRH